MSRAQRWENRLQVALMLAVGAVAAAASWSHVIALASGHGQVGWLAYADAAVIESAAVSAGLEMRRRHRAGLPTRGVTVVLVLAVGLQLAAQLAAAERSPWGGLLGAVPCVAFLTLAKLGLSRVDAAGETADVEPGQAEAGVAALNPSAAHLPPHPLIGLDVAELLAEVDTHLAIEAAHRDGQAAAAEARAERDAEKRARPGMWSRLADALGDAQRRPDDDAVRAWLHDQADTTGTVPGRAQVRLFWSPAPGSSTLDRLREEVIWARAERAAQTLPESTEV